MSKKMVLLIAFEHEGDSQEIGETCLFDVDHEDILDGTVTCSGYLDHHTMPELVYESVTRH